MEITRIIVRPVDSDSKLKARASVTFDDCFIVHGIRIVDGDKGFFIAMPSRRLRDGSYRDIAHPLNNETRNMIQDAVLEEYKKTVEEPAE